METITGKTEADLQISEVIQCVKLIDDILRLIEQVQVSINSSLTAIIGQGQRLPDSFILLIRLASCV